MAASNFDRVMNDVIFPNEGGYVDHPADPGGATNLGITIGTLSAHRKRPVTKAEVRALQKSEARAIYRDSYATPIRFDDLPGGLDAALLDYAVNSGPAKAAKAIQAIVGVEQDGFLGAATLAAIGQRDAATLINRLCDDRLAFLRRLRTWPTFGKGWGRRVNEVRSYALKLARQPLAAKPIVVDPTPAKAPPSDTDVGKTSAGRGSIAVIAGTAATTVGVGTQAAKDAIEPYIGVHRYIGYAVAALTIAGLAAAAIGGFVTLRAKLRAIDSGAPV